jgi:helicase
MKIKNITQLAVAEPYYDITVESNHNFFANGVLVKNCNTSAQNAIIVGTTRGLDEVDSLDIIQEAGRAGRFGMSPVGNVFLICDNIPKWKDKINNPKDVSSTLLDTYALSFHLTAEIKNGIIYNKESLLKWYSKTLASIQKPLTDLQIDEVLKSLLDWKAIKIENNTYEIAPLGRVAATLYFHPEDIHHFYTCFKHIDNRGLWNSDLCLAYALAAPSFQLPYIPRAEQDSVNDYMSGLYQKWGSGPRLKPNTLARDCHDLLTGSKPTPQIKSLQFDAERIAGAISWVAGISHIHQDEMLKILPLRLRYGVSKQLVELVQLPGIGVARAKKLAGMGITSFSDVIRNPAKVQSAVGEKNLKKVMQSARILNRTVQAA